MISSKKFQKITSLGIRHSFVAFSFEMLKLVVAYESDIVQGLLYKNKKYDKLRYCFRETLKFNKNSYDIKVHSFYNELTIAHVITHYQTDKAINQAYPVVQHSPPIGHIKKTANINRNANEKFIFFFRHKY